MADGVDNILTKASRVFKQFACSPTVVSAEFRHTDSRANLLLTARWSRLDTVLRTCITSSHDYLLDRSSIPAEVLFCGTEHITSPGCGLPYFSPGWEVLWDIEEYLSHERLHRRAVFMRYLSPTSTALDLPSLKAAAPLAGTYVILMENGEYIKTIQLPTDEIAREVIHGKVFPDSGQTIPFSSCLFSYSAKQIVYLAEHHKSSLSQLYSDKTVNGEESPFSFTEDWGEGLSGVRQPVICILDLESEEVECTLHVIASLLPELKNCAFDQPVWCPADSGILFIAYETKPYPLGLVFCSQRQSALYFMDLKGPKIQRLSDKSKSVGWPRFNPNGDKLIWFETPFGGPHSHSYELLSCDWPLRSSPIEATYLIQMVDTPSIQNSNFPGLYLPEGVRNRCWTANGQHIVLTSIWGCDNVLLLINVGRNIGSARRFILLPSPIAGPYYGSVIFHDILLDCLVVEASSPCIAPFLAISALPDGPRTCTAEFYKMVWLNITHGRYSKRPPTSLLGVKWQKIRHTADYKDERFGIKHFESILIEPILSISISLGSATSNCTPVGLLVQPNGGPYGVSTTGWNPAVAAFIACGFACLLVNYRGSIGYGNSAVHCLPGQIARMDVADCLQATREAQARLSNLPAVLIGTSYSSFIALHLAARPDTPFRAVVALNPVTDLFGMLATTDTPDWCWIEAGLNSPEETVSPCASVEACRDALTWRHNSLPVSRKQLNRLSSISPISQIPVLWSTALLVCIAIKDRRVPISQAIAYVHRLRAILGETRANSLCSVLAFPADNHSLSSPAAREEVFIRAVATFYRALNLSSL